MTHTLAAKEQSLAKTFSDEYVFTIPGYQRSHMRMVYRKAKPQGTLLKEFKEHVVPAQQPQSFVDDILLPMAQAFNELRDADYASHKHAEQVNEHLRWLNRLEFKDWVSPVSVFIVRYRQQPDAVLNFFRDLERLGCQHSERGRATYAERMGRCRAKLAVVTHQGPPMPTGRELSAPATAPSITPSSKTTMKATVEQPRCKWCGCTCSAFVRLGFLRNNCRPRRGSPPAKPVHPLALSA